MMCFNEIGVNEIVDRGPDWQGTVAGDKVRASYIPSSGS